MFGSLYCLKSHCTLSRWAVLRVSYHCNIGCCSATDLVMAAYQVLFFDASLMIIHDNKGMDDCSMHAHNISHLIDKSATLNTTTV